MTSLNRIASRFAELPNSPTFSCSLPTEKCTFVKRSLHFAFCLRSDLLSSCMRSLLPHPLSLFYRKLYAYVALASMLTVVVPAILTSHTTVPTVTKKTYLVVTSMSVAFFFVPPDLFVK